MSFSDPACLPLPVDAHSCSSRFELWSRPPPEVESRLVRRFVFPLSRRPLSRRLPLTPPSKQVMNLP